MTSHVKKLKRYQYERYAVLCNLAYSENFSQSRYGFALQGQRIVKNRWGKTMIRVLWSQHKREVIVVIKGSHSVTDWLLNLFLWPCRCAHHGANYHIHAGFYRLLMQESVPTSSEDSLGMSVHERLFEILMPLIQEGKRVSFTGHSSGGAIALVMADWLERLHPGVIKRVVTFGQPAIGCKNFERRYRLARRTYRICCDLDAVTFMPPIPLLYWHVGRMLWLYNGRIYEKISTPNRLWRSILSWILRPFSYHFMSKYIRNKDFFDEH